MTAARVLPVLLACVAIMSVVAFAAFGIDKWKAQHHRRRISERTLLWLTALGGSPGAWTGMLIWRHKTLHRKFRYGVPAIFVAQMAAVGFLLFYGHHLF